MSGPFTLLGVTAACAGECWSLRVLIGSYLVHTHISEMPASKLLEGAEGCIVSDGELAVTNSASNVFCSYQADLITPALKSRGRRIVWEGMAAGGRHCSRKEKLRAHILSHKQ